ncbi:MAG: hypothetical protein LAO23_22375 [Acidobacteriia bacterium]|nr:hypothetical protein [Terriglobia bacterium]
MLSHCLNPSCTAQFRFLHEGRIFKIERTTASLDDSNPQRLVEHYWLCGPCSLALKVVVENGVVTTQPIHPETAAPETAKENPASVR